MTISRAQLALTLRSWFYDGATAKTKNIGSLGGTATLGDGTTVGTFPTQLNPNGMSFDGGDYLDCGASVGDYTNNFTLFCCLTSLQATASDLIRRLNVTYQYSMYIRVTTGYLAFQANTSGAFDVASAVKVTDGVFHSCAAVVDSGSLTLYVDGVAVAGPTAVTIGAVVASCEVGRSLVGNIWLPQIYPIPLTPTQLRFLDLYARKFVSI